MKIAIFGSAIKVSDKKVIQSCKSIAETLVENDIITFTGVGIGIPHLIVEYVHEMGGKCIGYSPSTDKHLHNKISDNADLSPFDTVHFIKGFTKRSLQMIEDADAVIVLGGRMGTLSEFSIAYEENKVIGVITSIEGIGKHLKNIIHITKKHRKVPVLFDDDAKNLIRRIKDFFK